MQLVIDRNIIRRDLVQEARDPARQFIITDTLLVEMVRSPDKWRETFRLDFAAFGPFADRIKISVSVSEALRIESFEGRAITRAELLPEEFQLLLSKLIEASNETHNLNNALVARINNILPSLHAEQPAIATPKIEIRRLVEILGNLLGRNIIAELRNGRLVGDALMELVKTTASKAYAVYCETQQVEPLPQPDSMHFRYFGLRIWRAISWLQKGGLDSSRDDYLYHDSYDDDYILLGSFFDGLLSKEHRVNEAYAALMRIVEGA